MAEGYSRISDLLIITFTSHDDFLRKQAEQELDLISQDKKSIIIALLHIIKNSSNPNLRQASSTKLRNILKHLNENSLLTSLEQCQISEDIFNIMLLQIDKTTLFSLNLSLKSLLLKDKTGLVYSKLSNFVEQNINGPVTSIKACFQVIKLLFSTSTNNFSIKNYFQSLFPYLILISRNALTSLNQAFTTQNEDNIKTSIFVIKDWAECLSKILGHFKIKSPEVLKWFLENFDIPEIFLNIIFLKLSDSFISFDTNPISEDFTLMKANVLKSLNILMQYTSESKKNLIEEQGKIEKIQTLMGVDIPETPYVIICTRFIKKLIEILLEISRTTTLSEILSEPGRIFVIQSLDLCVKCCKQRIFFAYFIESYRNFIIEFIPNALTTTKDELKKIQTDPHEFVYLAFDICETQESENIKTMSAKLFETICENIDGALKFFICLIVQSFDIIFSDRLLNINSKQILDYTYDEEKVLSNYIIMLCTISYNISRREYLIQIIENLLTKYYNILVKMQSVIISSRLCLLMYFYAEHIFQNDESEFIKWIWFLINSMGLENSPQIVLIQACETFSALAQNDKIILIINSYIPEILKKLICYIKNQENKNFFEAICGFFKWYQNIPYDLVVELVQKLIDKILVLVSKLGVCKNKDILISKCWNIIKTACRLKSFNTDNRLNIEKIISPLIFLLGKQEAEIFEDYIVIVIMSIMRQNQKVSAIEWEVFSIIPELQLKQKGSLQNFLKLISYFIKYGHDTILCNLNTLFNDFSYNGISDATIKSSCLVELAARALYSKKDNKINEVYNSEGAILLQLLLISFPNYIDNALPVIISSIFARYKNPPIKESSFKIRLLCVILQCFVYNFPLTTSLLSTEIYSPNISYLKFAILEIINNFSSFKYDCDKKLMILGLSQILIQSEIPQDITNILSNIFEMLIIALSAQTSDKAFNTNKMMKNISQNNPEDFDDNETIIKESRLIYSDSNTTSLDKINKSIPCTQILTSLKDFDEISYFKNILHTLNTSNPTFIKHLITLLSEASKNHLINIITSTIITFDNSDQTKIVRKIVKAKRK
ncbi:hypothetical protein SteCoe_5199 [Stentor coeruleus]|uniref:Importin N-terminal domain-containing protein n=1 Tax=Stentor coeruleus TaxID=5963 RepID=A0A1R2CSX6_9CILI|nr:hypothetical protein SteCoe_5199 [Stentor coeruleus]